MSKKKYASVVHFTEQKKNPNPMVREHGLKENKKCRKCDNLIKQENGYRCVYSDNSQHDYGWQACKLYENEKALNRIKSEYLTPIKKTGKNSGQSNSISIYHRVHGRTRNNELTVRLKDFK